MATDPMPSLGDVAAAAASMTEAMGTLVASRKVLMDGGFTSEEAAAIIVTSLQSANTAAASA